MTFKFWLDDAVIIKAPSIKGVINEVRIEGQSDMYVVYYKVSYWNDGQMYSVEFTENELELTTPHEPRKVGFYNARRSYTGSDRTK